MSGYSIRKGLVLVLHLIVFSIFVAGVSIIYCNDNFKKGLGWINAEAYEDSPAFTAQLTESAEEILRYVRYRDVFDIGGEVDPDNEVFAFNTGDGGEEIWILNDVLEYAAAHGYSFDNDYHLVHDENAPPDDGQTFPVTWRAYRQETARKGPGDAFVTLEDLVVEVMTCLGDYYRADAKYNSGNSNLFYDIEIEGRRNYTNTTNLTPEKARTYGKYVILSSDTLVPDNNLPETPEKLREMLLTEVGGGEVDYGTTQYQAVFAVDTTFPFRDAFFEGLGKYAGQRDIYFIGVVLMLSGALLMLLTFLVLAAMSGRTAPKSVSGEIHLTSFDRKMPEMNALFLAAACIILVFLADLTVKRLMHMLVPEGYWVFAEKMIAYVIVYLCALPMVFSLIRCWKAHKLWEVSFLRRLAETLAEFARNITYARRLFIYFAAFLIMNLAGAGWIAWTFAKGGTLQSYFIAFGGAVVLLFADGWFFRKFYLKRVEADRLADAIRQLDSGEETHLDLADFEGREASLAATINNVSNGLQKALNDQVRSERMKAELITNVSHDIKTPLTSIINYVDLLRRADPGDPKIQDYINVLDQKSQHLKTLISDLVEASKASTGNVQINAIDLDYVELVEQTNGEFEERFEERQMQLIANLPKESIMIHADGQHLWRVLENLYNNAVKYAAPNSRVYVDMKKDAAEEKVFFTIKNISANPLNISPEELTERFVRGDVSRTTEGSGLGLSIAQSLTELQQGIFKIEIDGDYFKASVGFDILKPEAQVMAEGAAADSATPDSTGS